ARAQANEVGFQLDGLRQLILFEVEEAFRGLSIADAALTSTREAYRLSKEWLQMETVNFDLDLGDTENLVKAVRANLDLQADQYQATYRYNLAALKLLRSCGMLRQTIDSGILVE
ncbi:MAG: TolC family protein, partial [Rhodothermales bacterium]|nr:TolC family protein [Rhodothermales bacterium]